MTYPRYIDEKYYRKHDFLLYCNDILVGMLKYADKKDLSSVTYTMPNNKETEDYLTIDRSNEEWQDWLIGHGYKREIFEVYYRHTFFSLIADMCHYLFESMCCAAKMKIAVAYALLRKPLRDNLGYIEWLCSDKDAVIERLVNGPASSLELSKEQALDNISKVAIKYPSLKIFDAIFTFRYDKNSDISLERIWNKANHVLTTSRYTKTEDGNLNFIFLGKEGLDQHVDYYYLIMPYIMVYIVELIGAMFAEISDLNKYTVSINRLVWSSRFLREADTLETNKILNTLTIDSPPLICPKCGNITEMNVFTLNDLTNGLFVCSKCNKHIVSDRFMFYWETKAFRSALSHSAKRA